MVYRINATSYSVVGSCIPSREYFLRSREDVLDSISGRLAYFLDGSYGGNDKKSPAYYYMDAMDGDILWSYIADVYPELRHN
jgi:hypothetical protein